jgi:hypothetical protein
LIAKNTKKSPENPPDFFIKNPHSNLSINKNFHEVKPNPQSKPTCEVKFMIV